ncbi:unnamed protein product [Larinioides sclopetarius]|uniref:THAP-type domain-containing protein n=1 Tax=Larinioides sclopetarius TaxID=280406 RepID=A0AAV1Z044_9ARAC
MPTCCAVGCSNSEKLGFRFYRFPVGKRNEARRNQWVHRIARDKWIPNTNSRLCEVHFTEDQFENHRADNRRLLKNTAVPSVFNHRPPQKSRKLSKYVLLKDSLSKPGKNVAECKNRWASIRDTFPETTEPRKKLKGGEVPYTQSIYDEDDVKPLGIASTEKTASHLMQLETSLWSADYTTYPDQNSSQQGPALNFPEIKVEVESFDEEDNTDGNDPTSENGKCNFPYIVPNSLCEVATNTQTSTKRTSAESDEGIVNAKSPKRRELSSSESELIANNDIECKPQEHPIETFFKSMAATVLTFPPHLMAIAKLNVCKLITELELRALTEKNSFDGNQDRINQLLSENIVGMCSTNSDSVENGATNQRG